MNEKRISRRAFLGGTAASAFAFTLVPAHVFGGPNGQAPSDKLRIACIGCGGKGSGDVGAVSGESIVALCDVDENRAKGTFGKFGKVPKFKDWRVMLEKMGSQIDAVTVSTPDHHHAPASMMAMRMGKHVFCQKPLTHSIYEARTIAEAARKYKVVTQMGIQGHGYEGPRLVNEWLQAGWLGPVHEVWYWTDRPIWTQGIDRPKDTPPVPSTLDWDVWLGPAPLRPYNPVYMPFAWRGWWDFGSGALGDIACHAMDAAFWALKLGYPTSIEAESSPVNNETAPIWSRITINFPARGDMPPVKVVWNDGYEKKERPKGLEVPRPKDFEADRKLPPRIGGQLIVGEKATIMADTYCKSPRVVPETNMRELMRTNPAPKTLPRCKGDHVREWLDACKANKPEASLANFADYAGPLTEMVLIGNLALRTGKRIEWDAANMKCTNVPEANQYVRREYRKGWTL